MNSREGVTTMGCYLDLEINEKKYGFVKWQKTLRRSCIRGSVLPEMCLCGTTDQLLNGKLCSNVLRKTMLSHY